VEYNDEPPPDWVVNPSDYQYNGSIISAVYENGIQIGSTGDYISAWVGDECRGVESAIEFRSDYIFFLTVYSNVAAGEILNFKYWDSGENEIYESQSTLEFTSDMIIGSPEYPFVVEIGAITISKYLVENWNWFSLNIYGDDMSVNNVLASLEDHAELVKNQYEFSYYTPSGWIPPVDISNLNTYKIRMFTADTLVFTGSPINVSETPIPLASAGWHWPSYLPQESMEINSALTSIGANGELIKNISSFSYYVGYWFGALTTMEPLDGYMIIMLAPDTLIYPEARITNINVNHKVKSDKDLNRNEWSVNPHEYEFNGCITASVLNNGIQVVNEDDVLAAFIGEECRGVQSSVFNYLNENIFCLMVYSNESCGEILTFKYYDSLNDIVYEIDENVEFEADMIMGNPISQIYFNCSQLHSEDNTIPLITKLDQNYPNPFNPSGAGRSPITTINFSIKEQGKVTIDIFNIKGERVACILDDYMEAANHTVRWDSRDEHEKPVTSGIYFYRMKTDTYSCIKKMVLIK
jgi:hypothetical protein